MLITTRGGSSWKCSVSEPWRRPPARACCARCLARELKLASARPLGAPYVGTGLRQPERALNYPQMWPSRASAVLVTSDQPINQPINQSDQSSNQSIHQFRILPTHQMWQSRSIYGKTCFQHTPDSSHVADRKGFVETCFHTSRVAGQKGFAEKRVFRIPPSHGMWQLEKDLLGNTYSEN